MASEINITTEIPSDRLLCDTPHVIEQPEKGLLLWAKNMFGGAREDMGPLVFDSAESAGDFLEFLAATRHVRWAAIGQVIATTWPAIVAEASENNLSHIWQHRLTRMRREDGSPTTDVQIESMGIRLSDVVGVLDDDR